MCAAESREFNGSIGEGESDEEVAFSFNAEEVIRPLPREASCKGGKEVLIGCLEVLIGSLEVIRPLPGKASCKGVKGC